MSSWNNVNYKCRCGRCVECLGEQKRKDIYKAPAIVREAFFQKVASEEDALFARGFIKVSCPKCGRDRQVKASTLKYGFSCDKCGYDTAKESISAGSASR